MALLTTRAQRVGGLLACVTAVPIAVSAGGLVGPGGQRSAPTYEIGRQVFFSGTFEGNGRTCTTCHDPRNEYTVSPALVRERYASDPDDPLFRAVDSDDGNGTDYGTLLDLAVFRVTVPLAPNVTLLDDPSRRSITVRRGVPSIDNVALTAPYDQDGRATTLQDQAIRAIRDHMEPRRPPRERELDSLALFLDEIFYPSRLRALLDSGDVVGIEPGFSIPLASAAVLRGKVVFDRHCVTCHGGETGDRPAAGQTPRFATVFISEDNLPGFPLLHLAFRRPDGSVTTVTTPDPGRAAVTGDLLDLDAFKIPPLRGLRHTAPYFHDNSAATLKDVVDRYNSHFPFRIGADERDDLIAYMESL